MTTEITEETSGKKKIKNVWKVATIISIVFLIGGIISAFLIIQHNNAVLNDWKHLYQEESGKYLEENSKNQKLLNENAKNALTIKEIQTELVDLKKQVNEKDQIISSVVCGNQSPAINIMMENVDFSYTGNTSMHRELKEFVENFGETITTSSWNPIWNNVDVAMHKISVTGNVRFYFITFFNDSDFPELKNSVFWLDRDCFLDYPGF